MSESFANRVSRLISGSFNAMVDAVENASPEIVMEQSIREVDQAIGEIRNELGKVSANKHLASKKLMEENDRHEKFSEQISVALAQQRDDLAKVAIQRQMNIEAQIPVLESSVAEAADREKELEAYIAALKAKQNDMLNELDHFRAAQRSAKQEQVSAPHGSAQHAVDKATQAFERAFNSNSPVTTRNAMQQGDESKLAELEQLALDNRIQERLAALKAKQS